MEIFIGGWGDERVREEFEVGLEIYRYKDLVFVLKECMCNDYSFI